MGAYDAGADTRKGSWTPPARPEWVSQVNAEGRWLDIKGVVPLDEASLLNTAMVNTGLTDFGSDDWREPFSRFLASLEVEAGLNLMGRILTRTDILGFLEARLRIENAIKQNPAILEEKIEAPIWIIGLGRSGTTNLQTLLGLDPDNRTPRQWEVLFPTVVPGKSEAELRELADERAKMWGRVTPEINMMHDFAGDSPTEVIHFECLGFRCPAWQNLLGMSYSFTAWCAQQPYELSFAYAKRFLQVLQYGKPKRRWVLKSPDSIHYLPQLYKVFSDVRLVWAHRDPIKTMGSAASLVSTLTWIRSDQRLADGVFDAITSPPAVASSLYKPLDWIEQGIVPEGLLCNVQYEDLIHDPLATVRELYDFFGLDLSPRAQEMIRAHVAAHPREQRAKHSYATGDDAQVRAERQLFRRYQEHFKVPNEV